MSDPCFEYVITSTQTLKKHYWKIERQEMREGEAGRERGWAREQDDHDKVYEKMTKEHSYGDRYVYPQLPTRRTTRHAVIRIDPRVLRCPAVLLTSTLMKAVETYNA